MILQSYTLEVITPCFCGGAEPSQRAEIRPASIRGQLRWWFRVLGGFKTLFHQSVEVQEAMIFGSASGDDGQAGLLTVRVRETAPSGGYPEPAMQSPEGYFLFPLRNMPRHQIAPGQRFELLFAWRGDPRLAKDLTALATVLGNLGSLGFRSRRAMGALSPINPQSDLAASLARFNLSHQAVRVRKLQGACNDSNRAISNLANWLKSWRMHGRTQDLIPGNLHGKPPENIGFAYAKNDHDIGYNMPGTSQAPSFRAALGLPIIQKGNRWEWKWANNKASGRFASPVILRPHKDGQNRWNALVIFVDSMKWPEGRQVYLKRGNGPAAPRTVSLDLYEAMKADIRLQPFP